MKHYFLNLSPSEQKELLSLVYDCDLIPSCLVTDAFLDLARSQIIGRLETECLDKQKREIESEFIEQYFSHRVHHFRRERNRVSDQQLKINFD